MPACSPLDWPSIRTLLLGVCLSCNATSAFAQTISTMGDNDDDLRYLEEEDDQDDDLFDDPAPGKTPPANALLLEPVGLSVLPLLSYGLGYKRQLAPWRGQNVSLRARYARGSATLGQLYAVTELSTLEVAWAYRPWLFIAAGPAYRNVRADLKDALDDVQGTSSSTSTFGVAVMVGIERPLGTYLLGCDIAGIVLPVGPRRQRGRVATDLDDRDPHAETLSKAGTGRSTSVLRLYFGPRF